MVNKMTNEQREQIQKMMENLPDEAIRDLVKIAEGMEIAFQITEKKMA